MNQTTARNQTAERSQTTERSQTAERPTTMPLPERPRLAPGLEVLERENGDVQIGLDPRHAVVATGLPVELIDVLRGLDGKRSSRSVLAAAPAESADRFRDILTGLAARGLVDDARQPGEGGPPEPELWTLRAGTRITEAQTWRRHNTVSVHGSGRLAVALVAMLASAGIGAVAIEAEGVVRDDDLGSGLSPADIGLPRRDAMANLAQRLNPRISTTRITGERRPDIVALTDMVVPAPEVVSALVGDRTPHLLVRVRDGTGIVGPLVSPGRSSCLRCADLHRTARDSSWPRVASQLAGRSQRAELTSVQATASLAASQILRFLVPSDTPPPAWNATLEIDSFAGRVRHREWSPHPECGCRANVIFE